MITAITLQNLRHSEILQFLRDTLSIVTRNYAAAQYVKAQQEDLEKTVSAMEDLFKTERGNVLTEELQALDLRRDNAIIGLNAQVQGLSYHPDPAIRSHADKLVRQLTLYGGNIAKENYQSETAILDNILNDWATKPDLSAAITTLGLSAWMGELAAANKAFNEAYIARTRENGNRLPDTLRSKRQEATQAYYNLRDFLNSYYTINKGEEPFKKVADELNALIEEYNKLVAGRGKSTATEAPGEGTVSA